MKGNERTIVLLGKEQVEKIESSKIAIFGLGGVGGYVLEGLARCGVNNFILVDKDTFEESNLNRQLLALRNSLGQAKVDVAKERVLKINENAEIKTYRINFSSDTAKQIPLENVDFIIDCIDDKMAKLELYKISKALNIKIISSMGTGNKVCPEKFKITDISKTEYCPLAKTMRKLAKENNLKDIPVLWSDEQPKTNNLGVIGTLSTVPSIAGLLIANFVISEIIKS